MFNEFKNLRKTIASDLVRLIPVGGGIFQRIFLSPTFKFIFLFRVCTWLSTKRGLWRLLYYPLLLYYRHLSAVYGIDLRIGTSVGQGLCFAHVGTIVIHPQVKIGNNCLIFQGCTIGAILRPEKVELPVIGNNVTIFAGAKVIGDVHIGNNAVIAANAVVTKDVLDGEVVGGIPAKVLSKRGKEYAELYARCM